MESLWDERRWAMWRDPHQRLGYLVAMLCGLLFWGAAASHWRTFELYATLWIVAGSLGFVFVWLAVAARSRARARE